MTTLGERASIAHPWDMECAREFFAKNTAEELHGRVEYHGQSSELVHSKMDLEEYVEKMFFEEHTTHQMKEIWKLS
jgi:hypothetical protein